MEQAKELMADVANPKKNITLYINDAPATVRSPSRSRLPGRSLDHEHDQAAGVPAVPGVPRPAAEPGRRRLSARWIGDFVDAINFLELWTCESGNNSTNFCNEEYDQLIEEARSTEDNDARYDLYAQAEEILFGEDGEMPVLPIYFYTLRRAGARERP